VDLRLGAHLGAAGKVAAPPVADVPILVGEVPQSWTR
jgi:hypothetical protein